MKSRCGRMLPDAGKVRGGARKTRGNVEQKGGAVQMRFAEKLPPGVLHGLTPAAVMRRREGAVREILRVLRVRSGYSWRVCVQGGP